eukprot:5011486-Pyramimonas_sp.AAC.1
MTQVVCTRARTAVTTCALSAIFISRGCDWSVDAVYSCRGAVIGQWMRYIPIEGLCLRAERVINYELPTDSFQDYIHRIGRTGRAGATGQVYSLSPSAIGARCRYILSLLLRLVPAAGIFCLPFRDWPTWATAPQADSLFTDADRLHAKELIRILTEANQEVPAGLAKYTAQSKKFFDSDDDEE